MPKRILTIRLQAMGDLVITLPYLQQLKKMLPGCRIDLLTREEVDSIPNGIILFDKIYSVGGGRDLKKQLLSTAMMLPRLFLNSYDAVIDLQNNEVSKLVRLSLMPSAWSVFDRFSPIAAGESTRLTIEGIGLGKCFPDESGFKFRETKRSTGLLKENGWDGSSQLVVLNPAGAFETRNWPMENYVEFAKEWLLRFPSTQFLVVGTDFIATKAGRLEEALSGKVINLVNKTTALEAFAIIQKAGFVLSEDSGLMHMAWVSGIPTLAMFGSTRAVRSRPLGGHSLLLDSGDLPCGNCMLEICKFGDTHCLTRYSPTFVLKKAIELVKK